MQSKNLEAAKLSLLGLWIGDAFGGHFELDHVDWHRPARAAKKRVLPPAPWRYTDDTQMALSVYDVLRRFGEIRPNELARSFTDHFDISRGYGIGTEDLITEYQHGGNWAELAPARFDGKGSFGNGSAMRAAPIGAYFSDDLDAVVENAHQSSIITHTHPDAIAGAIAVALATAQSRCSTSQPTLDTDTFWAGIIDHTPAGQLCERLKVAAALGHSTSTREATDTLGSGWDVSAIDTVPFALWCASRNINELEEALWQTISVGGDTDTTGAIVGGIVAAHGKQQDLPTIWMDYCEPLPDWLFA